MITIEKATKNAEEEQVVTIINNEYEEKAVEVAISNIDAFNEGDVEKVCTCIDFPHTRVGANVQLVVSEKAGDQMFPNF